MSGLDARRQRGLTLWGWLYVLATMGVILMVGIKAVPVYMNNYDIRSTLEWASNQPELRNASVYEIRGRIQRRFDSGYVDNIKGKDVKVERVEGGRRLSVEYEVRQPLFYNITMLFEFRETAVIPHDR